MKKQVIIIGGGIVGSTAFYLSQEEQVNLTLIDSGVGTATRAAEVSSAHGWLRKNKDWYKLTSDGAVFYRQLVADLEKSGATEIPFKQTGTIGLKVSLNYLIKYKNCRGTSRRYSDYWRNYSAYRLGN